MLRPKAVLRSGARLSDHLAIAHLARYSPLYRVRELLSELGLQSKRKRGLPAEVAFFYVLSLCLYRNLSQEEVLRIVVEGLRSVYGDEVEDIVPTKAAISRARTRLGPLPLEMMYSESIRPVGNEARSGLTYAGLRVMVIDESTLDIADEKINARYFGYPSVNRGSSACPQLRFVVLTECATHVMTGAKMGPCKVSGQVLAKEVLKRADSSMLVLPGRGLSGYPVWLAAGEQGCKRLFQDWSNQVFPVIRELDDGSFISGLYSDQRRRKRASKSQILEEVERVRVIEFELLMDDGEVKSCRLITDLLDEFKFPAHDLAHLYHRRWRVELALDELKVHLNENMSLRSKRPDLVRQEFYAMLFVHGIIRKLMLQAADMTAHTAEELSFAGAPWIARRRLPGLVVFPRRNVSPGIKAF